MEGNASINLENKDYEVARGAGVYPRPVRNRNDWRDGRRVGEVVSSGGSPDSPLVDD